MMMQVGFEKMVQLASRTGRELQRYNSGRRQVVGCIPYRYVKSSGSSRLSSSSTCSSASAMMTGELEVLLISSQKSSVMMFPKGGWEHDETMERAAERESMEEAGVIGTVQKMLGNWQFESKSHHNAVRDGFMFPLLVQEQLDHWPEKSCRQRRWVKVEEARELCCHLWMKEALDALVCRLSSEAATCAQMEDGLNCNVDATHCRNLSAELGSKCSYRKLERPARKSKRQIEVQQKCC